MKTASAFALPSLLIFGFAVGCTSTSEQGDSPNTDGTDPLTLSSDPGSNMPGAQTDLERLSLQEQRNAYLVEQSLANARSMRDNLRFEEAEKELVRVLELEPDNTEARELFNEVGAFLGRPGTSWQSVAAELEQDYELRVQALRSEAKINLERGKEAFDRGEFENAITEFSLARDHVRWADYSIDWNGLDAEAEEWLTKSRSARDEAVVAREQAAQSSALDQMRAEEERLRNQESQQLATILDNGFEAFNLERYDEAERLASEALRLAPDDEQALDLRDAAFRAGHKQASNEYIRNRREQYKRWQESLDEMRIPFNNIITLPDEDFWLEITDKRKVRDGINLEQAADPSTLELRAQLASTSVPGFIVNEEESLSAVVGLLATLTGLPLHVDPAAQVAAEDEGKVFNFSFENPLTAERLLDLITEQAGEEVTWTVKFETILVTTREKARGELILYNHDVQDLTFKLTQFLGPRIDRLRLIDDLEDEDGGGPFGGLGEAPPINEGDSIENLVRENVAKSSWDETEGANIILEGGNMIVVQTPEVQRQIRQFLSDLRRFSSSLVTIESKFLNVGDNWIQEIGVDIRGLDNDGNPFSDLDDVTNGLEDMSSLGLDNNGSGSINNAAGPPSAGFYYNDGQDGDFKGRTENIVGSALGGVMDTIGGLTAQWTFLNDLQLSAVLTAVEKSENFELINDQVLSVHNTQRAYVTVVNQRAYIQDFDVEVAQAQAVADPQINVLHEGIVLDVRPTIHHDRKYLTLEIQPTVARVVALREFSTSLGSATSPVSFQLPELEVQSVFTTAVVPDGGSILIGGLSRVRNVNQRSEVPWLANIPVVGFFFKREGYNDERSSLMILISAWITAVKDALAHVDGR